MDRKEDIRRQIEEVRKMGEEFCNPNGEDVNGEMHKTFETQYNQVLAMSEEERKQTAKELEAHIKELEEKTKELEEHKKELEVKTKELHESRKDSEVKRKKYDEMNQLQQRREKTVEEELSKLLSSISEECIDKKWTISPKLLASFKCMEQALRRENESQRFKPEEGERLFKMQTETSVLEHDQMFGHMKDSVKVQLDASTQLKQELAAKDKELEAIRRELLDNNKRVKQLKEDLSRKEDNMVQKGKLDEERKDIIKEKDVVLTQMKECLGRKDDEVKNIKDDLATKNEALENLKHEMCEMQAILRKKDDQLAQLRNEFASKEGELVNSEHKNAELRDEVAEIERTNAGGYTGNELRAIMKRLTDLTNKANDSFRQMSRTMVIIHPVHSNTQQLVQMVEQLNRQVDALVIEHPQVLPLIDAPPVDASANASPTVVNQPSSSSPPSCGIVCGRCQRAEFPNSGEGLAILSTHHIECLGPDSEHGLQPIQCSGDE